MTTTELETTASPAATDTGKCPHCDSHVVFTVTLDYGVAGGFRLDHFGAQPEQGDTITRCDRCGAFWVHDIEPASSNVVAFSNVPSGATASETVSNEPAPAPAEPSTPAEPIAPETVSNEPAPAPAEPSTPAEPIAPAAPGTAAVPDAPPDQEEGQ